MGTLWTVRDQVRWLEGFDISITGRRGAKFKALDMREEPARSYLSRFRRPLSGEATVATWRSQRFEKVAADYHVAVLNRAGTGVHGSTTLSTVRHSYLQHHQLSSRRRESLGYLDVGYSTLEMPLDVGNRETTAHVERGWVTFHRNRKKVASVEVARGPIYPAELEERLDEGLDAIDDHGGELFAIAAEALDNYWSINQNASEIVVLDEFYIADSWRGYGLESLFLTSALDITLRGLEIVAAAPRTLWLDQNQVLEDTRGRETYYSEAGFVPYRNGVWILKEPEDNPRRLNVFRKRFGLWTSEPM